jgi:ABC-type transport system involved in multi-copper enzyme maturation permease subunit
MIVKEARADRWAVLLGIAVLLLRLQSVVTTDLRTQSLGALADNFDADFSLVASHHISAGSAFLWATFFNDLTIYLLVGVVGAVFGAGLVASEVSSGSIFVLLSRPVNRTRALLFKYGVAAALSLICCAFCGVLALAVGAWQGVAAPPLGGLLLSIVLLWLGMLFVMGMSLLYSVLVPSAFAAGVLGFFTTYVIVLAPLFHSGTAPHVHYFLGGLDWSIVQYWGSLGIYAGTDSPVKSLVVAGTAALLPAVAALVLFVRKAF